MFRKPVFLNEEWSWNMTLYRFIHEKNIPEEWSEFFTKHDDILKSISDQIDERIKKEIVVYPPINLVFRAFSLPINRIRVVILGQDCYHDGNAVGLCFSVPPNAKTNPSLRNIYDELEREGYKPNRNNSLSHWADQGCFMINTALTVEEKRPESHLHIWYSFSEKVIQEVSEKTKGVAWLLMGSKALEFQKYINLDRGHRSFVTSHPSPFSANKGFRDHPAFIGSGVFKEINTFLGSNKEIRW